jgi:Glycine rich protein
VRGPVRALGNGSGRRALRFLAAALTCAIALPLAFAATAAAVETEVFAYTGAEQEFEVPEGVHFIKVDLVGGTGGDAATASGGEADEVVSGLSVIPGTILYIEVGGRGESEAEGGEGGFNGGGDGAGGGGGASDIRTAPRSTPLSTEDTRLIVAAGGGGAGGDGPFGTGGDGGDAESQGGSSEVYAGGGAGNQTEGGTGASGCFSGGSNGGLGEGGEGGDSAVISGPGGGGGGGLYGGGGGGGACEVGSSGGGGGSSLVAEGITSLTSTDPNITITYNPPPTVTITSPVNGATFTQGQAVTAGYGCTPGSGTTLKTCAGPVANGAPLDTSTLGNHSFTVEAEDLDKGTDSETAVYTVVGTPGPPSPTLKPPAPPPIPDTFLGAHPKRTIKTDKSRVKVKFTFSSDVVGATFKCKLDKGAFVACTSPKTYKVKRGSHTFSVEAVGAGGTDSSPATFSFKVKKKN